MGIKGWTKQTEGMTMKAHRIEIAVNHTEADEFCAWLNERGHYATVGRTTGNYVDDYWTSSSTEAGEILNSLWTEYCQG